MTKLTTKQEALLGRVQVAADAYRDAKAGARIRLRELVEQQVADHRARMDHEVRIAFEAGVPKRQIREDGLSTTAPKTLEDSLARTAETAERMREESDPLAHRYTVEGTRVRVTLTPEDFEKIKKNRPMRYPHDVSLTGLYEPNGRGGWVFVTDPRDPMPVADGYMLPVNLWGWDSENTDELAVWAKEHVPKAAVVAVARVEPRPQHAVYVPPTDNLASDYDSDDDSWEQA